MKMIDVRESRPVADRRRQGRLRTGLTVEIFGPREDGMTFSGTLLNLSHAGLGLRLERRLEQLVLWASETQDTRTVQVRFGLPVAGTLAVVEARCRVVWSKHFTETRSCLGLEVEEFLADGQQDLEQYLTARIR